jgi:HK97 family phage prohead protease
MKLLTADAFREEAKAGRAPEGTVFRLATSEPQTVEGAARTKRFVFSDATTDHAGDTIDPKGWELDVFKSNPVALFAHMSWDPPIGRASNVKVQGDQLVGDIQFAPPETYDFADTIYRLVDGGYLKAVSVGFLPKEWTWSSDKDRPYGIDFTKQLLLEISVCPVPCNPNALGEARSAGVDTRPLVDWAEKVLDSGDVMFLPRAELETLRRQAKEPPRMTNRRKTAKSEDWTCGAARDLPLDPSEAWDGAAAEAAIFEHAGGDDFNPAVARKGFLAYDASAPSLRGSYKLPFAHVVDGELKAVKGGIRAAASRLPQTEIGAAAASEAQAVIDHYEAAFGMKAKAAGEGADPAGGELVGAPMGTCGRDQGAECGMKDPQECAVHYVPAKSAKAGRRISAATRAKMEEAIGYHEAATQCLKDVMDDGDDLDDDGGTPPAPADVGPDDPYLTPEERRLKEAEAIRASIPPNE